MQLRAFRDKKEDDVSYEVISSISLSITDSSSVSSDSSDAIVETVFVPRIVSTVLKLFVAVATVVAVAVGFATVTILPRYHWLR